ncbi:MAG: MerR family transcriptional regulator [Acidobacteriota bacterium]
MEPASKLTYRISAVSRRYGIHPQTLRLYERHGLLRPTRSEGNTRLYTERDLRQLEVILHLIRDLGVNLAGVEVVLHMRRRMKRLQENLRSVTSILEDELARQAAEETGEKLIPVSDRRLMRLTYPARRG